jgi:hypothetical protein
MGAADDLAALRDVFAAVLGLVLGAEALSSNLAGGFVACFTAAFVFATGALDRVFGRAFSAALVLPDAVAILPFAR